MNLLELNMSNPNLVMGEEYRISMPSIKGIAATLTPKYPQLNKSARRRMARKIAFGYSEDEAYKLLLEEGVDFKAGF